MVQRKLPTKLNVQPLHAHDANILNHHHNHRHLDLKSPRGADLKAKKMKKSASIKRHSSTPNYMKSTTSSDARNDQSSHSNSKFNLISSSSPSPSVSPSSSSGKKRATRTLTKTPSFKPSRAKCSPVAISICDSTVSVDSKSQKPTCSSTLKRSKFPAFLSLNPEGTSAIKVCPYTYCSLNGHHHPLPPLKSFLSARRKVIKKQRRPPSDVGDAHFKTCTVITKEEEEEEKNDFFLEIYTAGLIDETEAQDQEVLIQKQDSDGSDIGSDMEWETGYSSPPQFDYDYQYEGEGEGEGELDAEDGVGIKVSSDGKDWCFDESLMDEEEEACQESCDEEGFTSDAFSSSDDGDDDLQSSITVNTSPLLQVLVEDEENNHILSECNTPTADYYEVSFDDPNQECVEAAVEDEFVEAEGGIGVEMEREELAVLHFSANKKKVAVEEDDELGAFNPRAPNFLMVEPDPEAEKVDLRHQDLDERKNAEEWMVDYALRQVVTKLGHARKRKVALLVEAFEKVTPPTKFDLHLSHGSAFDRPRQVQACS